jgi:hypothetical protein
VYKSANRKTAIETTLKVKASLAAGLAGVFGAPHVGSGRKEFKGEGEAYLVPLPFLCTFRHLAQRALWAAASFLRLAGDIVRPFWALIETTFCPLRFAHRAR